jgi:hypothetical protein
MSQRMLAVLRAVMLCVAIVTTALGAIGLVASFVSPRAEAWALVSSVADAGMSLACLLIVQRVCPPPLRRENLITWTVLNCLILAYGWLACCHMIGEWIPESWGP